MQALSMTCQHLNTYASIELSQMRSEIIALELKILIRFANGSLYI